MRVWAMVVVVVMGWAASGRAEGRVSSRDEVLDVPRFTWADPETRKPWRELGLTPVEAARRALLAHATQLRLTPARIAAAVVTGVHDLHDDTAVIVTFEQRVNGRRLFHDELKVIMSARLEVVAISGALTPHLARRGEFSLAASTAITSALRDLGPSVAALAPREFDTTEGGYTRWALEGAGVPVRTRPLYFPQESGVVPAFWVEVVLEAEAFSYVVSAVDGAVLYRHDLTARHSFSVWADPTTFLPWPGPRGPTALPLASPMAPLAPVQQQPVVTLRNAGLSTNDPWLLPGALEARGNNVIAYSDLGWPSGYNASTDELALPTSPDTWAWPWTSALFADQTLAQRSASAVHLFYVTNFLHDWFYDDGFDERSGNGQASNYSRGGAGNDALLAESLDWSGWNNANMMTPADGRNARMQMYAFSPGGRPTRDSSMDTSIVAHEWGHFISNRLIGNGDGLDTLQAGALGEGWGDFHAALLLTAADDVLVSNNAQWQGAYPVGAWAMEIGGTWAGWYGIRRYPLSSDLAINPLTFRHIVDGEPLPRGVPISPFASNPNAEIHNAGEVWAVMLWDCYVSLLSDPRFTFDEARARMKRTLVAAYKATPLSPTFVEARDAVLAVAAANDARDLSSFWTAFARRGMGSLAAGPDRAAVHNYGVSEDFTVGGSLDLTALALEEDGVSCDGDGALDVGEAGKISVRVRNLGTVALTGATITLSSTAGLVLPTPPRALPDVASLDVLDVVLPARLEADVTGIRSVVLTVAVVAPRFARKEISVEFRCNVDVHPASSATDDVEVPQSTWTVASDPVLPAVTNFRRERITSTQHVWRAPSPIGTADFWLESGPLDVGPSGLEVTFLHRFDFDRDGNSRRDGAVIELSEDDGVTWSDVGSSLTPGYAGTIDDQQQRSTNPLAGRQAFVGESPGYPSFVRQTLALPLLTNRFVRLRFRVGGDDGTAWVGRGWELDELRFTGLRDTPFASLVADPNSCVNRAPVASVGPSLEVDEGTRVTLVGSALDPDGDAVTLTWTQVSGPAGVLTGSAFTAPEVLVDTPLTLSLVASDGRVMSAPALLEVMVKNVNRVPTVRAPIGLDVRAGQRASLTATASDSDGDALTYEWRQRSGPALVLEGADAAQVAFTAPLVPEVSVIELEVVARDALSASTPAVVRVTVTPEPVVAIETPPEPKPAGCGCTGGGGGLASLLLLGLRRRGARPARAG